MDFVTSLSILTDWNRNSYDTIFIIVNWLRKMFHFELIKIMINAPSFVEIIINIV